MKLTRFNKAVKTGIGLRTTWGIGKHPVLTAGGEGSDGAFIGIVVDVQQAMLTVTDQSGPLLQGVLDRFTQCRFWQYRLCLQPGFERKRQRINLLPFSQYSLHMPRQ